MPVILILNDKQGYPLLFLCSLTKWPVVSTKTISSVNFSLAVMVACVIFAGHYLHQGKGEVNLFYFAIFLFCLSMYSFYKHAQHMKKRQLSIQGYGHASRWLALRRHH